MCVMVVENKPEYEVAEAAEVVQHCLNLLVNTAGAIEHCRSYYGGEEPECEVVKAAEAAAAEKAIGDYAWAVCRAVKTHP